MTISSENRKAGPYSGNASTTQFPFYFKVFQASDLMVVLTDPTGAETDLALTTNFTVTLNADQNANPGGTVTYPASGSPMVAGYELTISSQIPNTQPVDVTNQGGFYPKTIGDAFDRLTILIQQAVGKISRSFIFPISDQNPPKELPGAAARANMALAFDSNGDPIVVSVPGDANLQDPTNGKGVDLVANATKKVPSIATLKTLRVPQGSDADTVVVQGYATIGDGGGGVFAYLPGYTVADNGGTVIMPNSAPASGRWVRLFTGAVHAEWWGALPGTGADLSVQVGKALAYLGTFGTLAFGPGTFLFNVDIGANRINFKGAGMNKTTLTSFAAAEAPIIIGGNASWDNLAISDLTLAGDAGTTTKIGIQFGHTTEQSNDQYAGRAYFSHVKFVDLDKCIYRPYGNIGVYVDGCVFDNSNYHIWSKGSASPLMHAGCFLATRSHFTAAQLAHCYLDSTESGTGMYEYGPGCIVENNPGFLFFVKNFHDLGTAPGLNVRGVWNESNYTAASVTIDGVAYTPGFANLTNTDYAFFERCNLGRITLTSSHLVTKGCDLDNYSITQDTDSTVIHDDVIGDSIKTKSMCRTVYIGRGIGPTGSFFRAPHRRWTSKAYSAKINFQKDCTAVISFSGSTNVASVSQTDGVLFTTAQDLTISAGQQLQPGTFAVNPGKYYVWFIAYKWMSGSLDADLEVSYGTTLSGGITLNDTDWVTIAGMTNSNSLSAASSAAFLFYGPSTGSTTVRLGGMAVCEFSTRQAAMEFLDSLAFPIP